MINTHLSLATALARRYQHRGVEFDDLQQLAGWVCSRPSSGGSPKSGSTSCLSRTPPFSARSSVTSGITGPPSGSRVGLRDRYTEVQSVTEELEQRLGHAAKESELAEAAGIDVEQVHAGRVAVLSCKVLSLDELSIQAAAALRPSSLAETDLQRVEDLMMVRQAMEQLTDRERKILRLRYFEGMSQLKNR